MYPDNDDGDDDEAAVLGDRLKALRDIGSGLLDGIGPSTNGEGGAVHFVGFEALVLSFGSGFRFELRIGACSPRDLITNSMLTGARGN